MDLAIQLSRREGPRLGLLGGASVGLGLPRMARAARAGTLRWTTRAGGPILKSAFEAVR